MSQNDVLALNANFTTWMNSRAPGLDLQPFLYYAIEQVLKPFSLRDEDIRYGITDHPNDGGIDGLYYLVNKNVLVRDDIDVAITGVTRERLILIQVKSSDTDTGFKAGDIDKFTNFTDDLLNLSVEAATFSYKYEQHLITIMQTFKDKHLQVAGTFPEMHVEYYYITKGDEEQVGGATKDAIGRLQDMVRKHLRDAKFHFHTINTQELLEFARKRRQTARKLTWTGPPLPIDGGSSYVGLVKLRDYYQFLKDEDGDLDELIFESNVRGYQQDTPVNRQIRKSLLSKPAVDFWLLNNGVTIISGGGRLQPIDALNVSIEDPQVVNGLQTSREIFAYFDREKPTNDDRTVMARVIRVTDEAASLSIIRATNSQNSMKASALRGADDIHRQIDEFFRSYNFYYDRRPGFYKDQQVPIQQIVGVTELVQALIALVVHRPDDARGRPGDYLREDLKGQKRYSSIFGVDAEGRAKLPIGVYVRCIKLMRRVEEFLRTKNVTPGDQRNTKFHTAYYVCCILTDKVYPSVDDVLRIESATMTNSVMEASYGAVREIYDSFAARSGANVDIVARSTEFLRAVQTKLSDICQGDDKKKPVKRAVRVRDKLKDGEIR